VQVGAVVAKGSRAEACAGRGGGDTVCHLRALFKSEKAQWEAFWGNAA
jgi:hypothetical protein